MVSPNDPAYPNLPATSWAVLGMLTHSEPLTGYDAKKWADWSIGFFYWSPSISQVYAELKKLESLGLAESRVVTQAGERDRREYAITELGTRAARDWSREAPVEAPVLKHGVMLRLWMGHLNKPEELKAIVRAHIENIEGQRAQAALRAEHSRAEPGWAFPTMSLTWATRYFDAELDLARALLDDIDEAARQLATVKHKDGLGNPVPIEPGRWRAIEDFLED
ncbi:PadR family transcriptional regulator [Tomitella biformata]|uniref:PadR family transcriptional regulator n=1 Tax=Tomitella biformata TaxID=630403 RepID=UPI0004633712|nr:PadR family transcriptional regulator [Tomitella biformata]